MGVETARLSQPKMITRQDRPRLMGIAGTRARAPGGVSLHRIQPTDEVARGTTHGTRPGEGIGPFQMQSAYAAGPGIRLGSDLDQIIPACQ